jgi:hypothetical protein
VKIVPLLPSVAEARLRPHQGHRAVRGRDPGAGHLVWRPGPTRRRRSCQSATGAETPASLPDHRCRNRCAHRPAQTRREDHARRSRADRGPARMSSRLMRTLLKLYPRRIRNRYSDELLDLENELRAQGEVSRTRLIREHARRSAPDPAYPPAGAPRHRRGPRHRWTRNGRHNHRRARHRLARAGMFSLMRRRPRAS